jgi:hypothetical protein
MRGYAVRKGDRWYAVVYEGLDPVPARRRGAGIPPAPAGRKQRSWRPGWQPS